jgi:Mg-chelatase subunit ChlD
MTMLKEESSMLENQFGDHLDRPVRDCSTPHTIALVIDVSTSMNTDGRIQSLNDAVNDLIKDSSKNKYYT